MALLRGGVQAQPTRRGLQGGKGEGARGWEAGRRLRRWKLRRKRGRRCWERGSTAVSGPKSYAMLLLLLLLMMMMPQLLLLLMLLLLMMMPQLLLLLLRMMTMKHGRSLCLQLTFQRDKAKYFGGKKRTL
jgi:hypothetical protein